MCLIHSWLRRLRLHCENNSNAKGPLLPSKRTPFAHQNEPFCTPIVVVLQSRQSPLQCKSTSLAYVNGNFGSRKCPFAIKTGLSAFHQPIKIRPQNSRIRFSFVTLFYCHNNICILTSALPFMPSTFIKT